MNTSSITRFEPYRAELFTMPEGLINDLFFVAEPVDLDYDEPNAVVSVEQTEFVAMSDAVQCVDLPVAAPSQPAPVAAKIIQRTAA